ncbi:hypothetical protein QYF36_016001 [Acer negundo]|nr:hypothetical protein QYF36_016001 [Acer negundo]
MKRKRKRKSKKMKQNKVEELKVKGDSVTHNIAEKLESRTLGEQFDSKGERAIGGEGETAVINGSGELKVEVESKRKKRKLSEGPNPLDPALFAIPQVRSKKRKLNTIDVAPIDIVGKMVKEEYTVRSGTTMKVCLKNNADKLVISVLEGRGR